MNDKLKTWGRKSDSKLEGVPGTRIEGKLLAKPVKRLEPPSEFLQKLQAKSQAPAPRKKRSKPVAAKAASLLSIVR